MTQEEKSLLLKELCARLPYGVKCKWEHEYDGKTYTGGGVLCDIDHVKTPNGYRYWDCYFEDEGDDIPIELVKLYLRPMSSMTRQECTQLNVLLPRYFIVTPEHLSCLEHINGGIINFEVLDTIIDFYNSHHLDWRGLIPKGLALEAPKDMYKFK